MYNNYVSYDAVISTPPAPQNYQLLNEFPSLQKTLKTGSYHACIALMFSFEQTPAVLKNYYDFYKKPGILSWMAAGSNLNVWTARTNEEFSDLNFYKSKNFLKGSKLDFVNDLIGSYFKISNPNANSTCGCGTSFSI